jgi:hypothetical protein
MPGFASSSPWVEVMLANCRDIWEQITHTWARTRRRRREGAFEEWLYRRKDEDTVADEFRMYSTAGSAIPATEKI